ncbi:MAG: hypothetical protein HC866_05875 [Leptolyngbyaceae cyanobacterium RU_5_1]|nr:hypothetical protein [Leptolyngbyaceae cyanobacterium RU_5_1]
MTIPPVNFLVMDSLCRGRFGRQSGDISETFDKTCPYVTGIFTAGNHWDEQMLYLLEVNA